MSLRRTGLLRACSGEIVETCGEGSGSVLCLWSPLPLTLRPSHFWVIAAAPGHTINCAPPLSQGHPNTLFGSHQNTQSVHQGQAPPLGLLGTLRSAERTSYPFSSLGALTSSIGCSTKQTFPKAVVHAGSSTPQPDPSYLPSFSQALASIHCSLCLLAFSVFPPRMHQLPPTTGPLFMSPPCPPRSTPSRDGVSSHPWSKSSLYMTTGCYLVKGTEPLSA